MHLRAHPCGPASPTTLSATALSTTAPPVTAPSGPASATVVAPVVAAPPTPGATGTCPYLSRDDVSAFNGERVYQVRLDGAFDPPACFFARADGQQQLSVWVYRADSPASATAAVDRAAPRQSTDPAEEPPGWSGGSDGGPDGAVYAVARGPVAVIVRSNQDQSVKARRITEQVIATLGL